MKTYELRRGSELITVARANNIDHALDQFFSDTKVDVDLSTSTDTRLNVRPLHQRKSLPSFVIEERAQ